MINLFDISGGKPVPSAHCYIIPILKRIMDTFPTEYLNIYAYVFYLTCPDSTMNPYTNKPEGDKEQLILSDLKPQFDIEDPIIIETIEWCKKMYETPRLRAFMGAKMALDRIGKYLQDTEITDGKDGSASTIERYMLKLPEFEDTFNTMENKLKEEQAKVRGNVKIPYWQQSSYVDTKADKEDDDEQP
jgi:hypothetical protein